MAVASSGTGPEGVVELVLVRHGQPMWVDDDRIARNDPGLTRLGRAQAAAMAGALAPTRIDHLVTSTATRARQTVAPLADLLGVEPVEEPLLHEIRMSPDWDGVPVDEIGDWFRTSRRRGREEWWQGAPGGEDFGAFHQRVCEGIDGVLAGLGVRRVADDGNLWDVDGEDARRVCIVAHAGTNSVVLGHLLGIAPEPWEWERFASSHAGITTLRSTPIAGNAIWSLQSFDDVAHLPEVTS